MQNLSPTETAERIKKAIAEKPDGILEVLAEAHAVPLQSVVECLPGDSAKRIDGAHFIDVLSDIAGWGDITFICHSKDAIVEFAGRLPAGKMGHGMYNLAGGKTGLAGHLRPESCKTIFFVRRPFMGLETLSVQFFNGTGEAIFKIFVGRDEQRRLLADQVQRFAQLEARFLHAEGRH